MLEPGPEPVSKRGSSKTLTERLRVRSLGVNLFLPPRRTSKIPTRTGALDSTQVMRLPKEQSAGQHMFRQRPGLNVREIWAGAGEGRNLPPCQPETHLGILDPTWWG